MVAALIGSIQHVGYHRNGICGMPFYAVRLTTTAAGSYNGAGVDTLLATVFPDVGTPTNPVVAVVDPAQPAHCYRGEHFAPELLAAVAAWQAAENARWAAMGASPAALPTCLLCDRAPAAPGQDHCPRCAAAFAAQRAADGY